MQKAAGPAGQRHDALERVRRRFPAAAPSLARPWRAHELARAAYLVEQLDERAAAAAPPTAPDFGVVYRHCERAAAAARRPRWRDFGGSVASPAERRAEMEEGLVYLEGLAEAIRASPAWLDRLSGQPAAARQGGSE